jgi:hypothetical protein
MFKQIILAQDVYHKDLDAMCIKCSIMTRAKYLIEMFKILKNEIFGNFGPLTDYGAYWMNLIIVSFKSENNRYSRDLYKKWSKFISFDMRKKGNVIQVLGFMGEKK